MRLKIGVGKMVGWMDGEREGGFVDFWPLSGCEFRSPLPAQAAQKEQGLTHIPAQLFTLWEGALTQCPTSATLNGNAYLPL